MKVGSKLGKSSSQLSLIIILANRVVGISSKLPQARLSLSAARLYYPHLTQFFPVTTFVPKTALLHML